MKGAGRRLHSGIHAAYIQITETIVETVVDNIVETVVETMV